MIKSKFVPILFSGLIAMHCFAPHIIAEIQEISSIESVQNYVKPDSIVLINVGDTLFSPSSMLADNQWRLYFVERTNQLVSNKEKSQSIIDAVKAVIVEKIPKVTPEQITPSFIASLQEALVPVYGYSQRQISTSYAENNGEIVSNHLLGMGIFLERTILYFPTADYSNKDYAFQYGIIFTNKNPVGPAITEFLTLNNIVPSQVIIVDDDLVALNEVETSLGNIGVKCIGLRYNRIDDRKGTFDANIATLQFFAFIKYQQLLSDQEALQIHHDNPDIDYQSLLDEWILLQEQLLS